MYWVWGCTVPIVFEYAVYAGIGAYAAAQVPFMEQANSWEYMGT